LGGKTKVLLDAGFSVRELQKRLAKFSVSLSDLDAVFVTHEHVDHSRSVHAISSGFGVPVVANPATLGVLSRERAPLKWWALDTGKSAPVGDLLVESFPISHDARDPVGYNFYCKDWKVSFVTDTGVAGEEIVRSMEGADLAIVEANHDVERLKAGPYPQFLKRRILSDLGHLSNDAAADLILKHLAGRTGPTSIWLGHLSDTNNTPEIARSHIEQRLSEAGCENVALDVALQHPASLTWHPGITPVQTSLFEPGLS
jgi:phosphoribosyl 1,2-cyclic phosphodiesterase